MITENLHNNDLLIRFENQIDDLLFINIAFKYDWIYTTVEKWLDVVIINNSGSVITDIFFSGTEGVHPLAGLRNYFKHDKIPVSDRLAPLENTLFTFHLFLDFISILLTVNYTIGNKRYKKKIRLQDFPDYDDHFSHGVYNLIDYKEYQTENFENELQRIGILKAIEALKKEPELLKITTPYRFEEITSEILSKLNFDVEHVGKTGDQGVDIIAISNNDLSPVRFLLQCKHSKNKIGVDVIRELLGCKTDLKASKAVLVTTSSFTKGAKAMAERNTWEIGLIDFHRFKEFLILL